MDVYPFNTDNTKALSASYAYDEFVSVDKTTNVSEGQLTLISNNILSAAEDTTTNYYNKFFLTDYTTNDLGLTVDTNKSVYPKYIVSTLKLRDQNKYLHGAGTNRDILQLSGTSTTLDANSLFEIILINEEQCAVRQYDYKSNNSTLKYFTVADVNVNTSWTMLTAAADATVVPVSASDGNVGTTQDRDTQVFNYLYDEGNGYISLFKTLSAYQRNAVTTWVLSAAKNSGGMHTLKCVQLSGAIDTGTITNETVLNDNTVFELRKTAYAPSTLSLNDTWVSYVSSVNDLSLDIELGKTVDSLKNNKIITTTFNNVTANNYNIDILPLKNQLNAEGKGTKNNIFNEDVVTHRKYTNLYTGTNQELGSHNVFAGYNTGTKEVCFHPDKLTYFHIPYTFTPYVRLSIHDSKFVGAGAIAGDRPASSDKVFLKRSEDYKNNLMPQTDDTWVCSWLSGDGNINGSAVWVDRYYNPSFLTKTTALTSDLVQIIDDWSSFVVYLSAKDFTVFDVKSNLVFEAGTAYAYHHIGHKDSQTIIDKCKNSIISDDIDEYRDGSDSLLTKPADNKYVFNSNEYGVIKDIDSRGSFDLNFWMKCDDWTVPFGNQIIGNYIDSGFGIFNEQVITPSFVIPRDTAVDVYNTDFVKLDTHTLDKNIRLFKKSSSTSGYFILDDQWVVYEYDHDGVIKNKIDLSSRIASGCLPSDMDIDDHNIYICTLSTANAAVNTDYNSRAEANVVKYDLKNQDSTYKGEVIKVKLYESNNNTMRGGALTGLRIAAPNTTSHPLFGTNPIVVVADYKTTIAGVSAINKNFVIDNDGDPWFIANNNVWTYDRAMSAAGLTVVRALSSQDPIVSVDVDKSNNIWVLYGEQKIAKIDKDRNVLFTNSLTATPSGFNSRNIDFVYEFGDEGYDGYAVVFNEVSGAGNFIKVDLNTGNVIDVVEDVYSLGQTDGRDSLSGVKSFNGFETVRRFQRNDANQLRFKIGVVNQFNTSTATAAYSAHTLTFSTSGLSNNNHNFHVSFNAEKGLYRLHVDSLEQQSISLAANKFSFLPVLDSNITIGATPYIHNILLHKYTKQPKYHRIAGVEITNLKLYSKNLQYYELKSHYRLRTNIEPVKFDMAAGNRNYLDEIERTFKFKIPGRKSEFYNVDIRGTGITDGTLKNKLVDKVIEHLGNTTPAYTKLNKVDWDGVTVDTLTLTGRETNIETTNLTTQSDTDSTSTSTGDGY
jgi:hypothetical protein